MNNRLIFLLGLFAALAIAFGGIVLGSHAQLGNLTPYYDDGASQSFPLRTSGLAARGQLVYADLGCAACHTQQVRRPNFGSDQARGWGERQSVARDYLFQARPQLGGSRIGPDLANFGARAAKANTADPVSGIYGLLYNGTSAHPSYRFLFEERQVVGESSANALKASGVAAKPGHEIVATERAQTLAAYLLSLANTYDYPESRPVVPEAKAPPAAGAAPAKQDVTPVPAAAPDEKKKTEAQKK